MKKLVSDEPGSSWPVGCGCASLNSPFEPVSFDLLRIEIMVQTTNSSTIVFSGIFFIIIKDVYERVWVSVFVDLISKNCDKFVSFLKQSIASSVNGWHQMPDEEENDKTSDKWKCLCLKFLDSRCFSGELHYEPMAISMLYWRRFFIYSLSVKNKN